MSYSDLNIHLPFPGLCGQMLEDETQLSGSKLIDRFHFAVESAGSNMQGANIMLFNQDLALNDIKKLASAASLGQVQDLFFTFLSSPERILSFDDLSELSLAGISAVKFHSYRQKISSSHFSKFLSIAKWAEGLQMPILIDASFGSLQMYQYDNLRLIACIAEQVSRVPIVILHSGGARAIEAMLLAESATNIFLDMSFSIPYYLGSSVEQDYAFAYKKIGVDRVVYGSDYPYLSHDKSLLTALEFCERNGFTEAHKSWLFRDTFRRIFSH